ncbi:hypothetical protein SAMN05216276_103572 [Streptosporangium subroseum]|uniref:WxL domain surface cell wall-binding n=1 Tax=Streptosporangium subroseum TaxID=106412 RepID=A0A239LXJ8_9ACTN|nr:hypothetical protein [Streptosporangium subroseum]SNT34429.1 hypothetical protein SAMN05216276_103572 [Streptosporangium subroseum]
MTIQRKWLLAAAAALTASVAFQAPATADPGDGTDVKVTVEIEQIKEPGVLAMSIAADSVALSEDGSTLENRQFLGTLPTVTVTDTRTMEEVPSGAAWAVLGNASNFTGDSGQAPISAGHLGWKPRLIDGGETGLVAEGEEVVTVLDEPTQPGNNVGLVDQELLASTFESGAVAGGAYAVNADLFLRTPADVAAGSYASTLTLSLFE